MPFDRRYLLPLGLFATAGGVAGAAAAGLARVNRIGAHPRGAIRELQGDRTNHMFERYPELSGRIPWLSLGEFPTPVEPLHAIEAGSKEVWTKRDDLSSPLYGGNKVRKLEFLLADAVLSKATDVITLGAIGSNHALATAVHGRRLGLKPHLVLYDQPITPTVRRNFSGFVAQSAEIVDAGSLPAAFAMAARVHRRLRREGRRPFFLMVGGTSRLGCLGYVNAGLELARQISDGLLPVPRKIFLPLGTTGTAAGLLVGLRLGHVAAQVVGVRVIDGFPADFGTVTWLAGDLSRFLYRYTDRIPPMRFGPQDFHVEPGFLGDGYGHPTDEGDAAIEAAKPALQLDPTYTGKAFAALISAGGEDSGDFLFWNTYNSAAFPTAEIAGEVPERLLSKFSPTRK